MKKFLASLVILMIGSFAFSNENTFKNIDTANRWLDLNFDFYDSIKMDVEEDIIILSLEEGIGIIYSAENDTMTIRVSPCRVQPVDTSRFLNILNRGFSPKELGTFQLYKLI